MTRPPTPLCYRFKKLDDRVLNDNFHHPALQPVLFWMMKNIFLLRPGYPTCLTYRRHDVRSRCMRTTCESQSFGRNIRILRNVAVPTPLRGCSSGEPPLDNFPPPVQGGRCQGKPRAGCLACGNGDRVRVRMDHFGPGFCSISRVELAFALKS